MSDRDELAADLLAALEAGCEDEGCGVDVAQTEDPSNMCIDGWFDLTKAADTLLAAGWLPPHVPPTRDEIEARYANLPDDIARHQAQARAEGRPGLSPQEMSRLLPG